MAKPTLLVLSFSNLATDPRVNRQLRLLAAGFRVTAAGFADPGIAGVEFVALPSRTKSLRDRLLAATRLKLRQFTRYYWNIDSAHAAREALRGRPFDVIIANDANTWPLAASLRGRARLLLDAHEYAPREFEDLAWWRIFHQPFKTWLCREFLGQADAVLTVCPGIAEEYHREFGVRPVVVMNVPPRETLNPSPTAPDRIRMVHHGGATRSRKIENMIEIMAQLDERFALDLVLVPSDPAYFEGLKRLAAGRPNIRFVPPLPMREIASRINGYDVGLYLLEPNSFNNLHALPNKFFEFIQARLAVAIGPSPEMAGLVRQHACGLVAPDFTPHALAAALRPLTREQIDGWKDNAHRAADVLCWERESVTLRTQVDRLVALGPCAG
jgi:glycosyltransferase involved in cell wall biosynthesis